MSKTWSWAILATVLDFDFERTVAVCQACGVQALEFNHRGVADLREQEIKDLGRRYQEAGITINSFHLPFAADDDIASFYETRRRAAARRMVHWIQVAGWLGANVVVQHPTTDGDPAEENGLDRYFEQLYKSLDEMIPAAEEAGVVIALENMTPGPRGGRFGSEESHFRRIAQELSDPNVGFIYDTGHALLSAGDKALDLLEAMGSRVVAWHLADNPGDRDAHLTPGYGEVDWTGVFRFAKEMGFQQPMTMETVPWGAGPDYSVDTWKKSIDNLDALVAQALSTE